MSAKIDFLNSSKNFSEGIRWLQDRMNSLEAFQFQHAICIYVLKKVGSNLVDNFLSAVKDHSFWEDWEDWIIDEPHLLWFYSKIGLETNAHFLKLVTHLIKGQSIEGCIHSNEFYHTGPLRVLATTKPQSETLSNAIKYWEENWRDHVSPYDAGTLALGILALREIDYKKYSNIIHEQVASLKSIQKEQGYWGNPVEGKPSIFEVRQTSLAIWAISKACGANEPSARNGLKWLKQMQKENGSWYDLPLFTAWGLLGLLAMGEGPKVPQEFVDEELMKMEQESNKQKPFFVHTSPLYQRSLHVKEIYEKIWVMLHNAQNEIRISSPFIDILYEEIINLISERPDLSVKIITRPKKEVSGTRERIAKNVVDLLKIATKGNVVQSDLVHSRIVIIDEEEVLISTADLTRDQLFDEFNAGIWTSDKSTVKKAIDFFENLFTLEPKEE